MLSSSRSYLRVSTAMACLFLSVGLASAQTKTASLNQISFQANDGKRIGWKDLAGKKATVVVFLSFDCPMSTSYAKDLSELATAYKERGMAFVGLCPCDDSPGRIAAGAKEYQLSFSVFK